MPVRCDIRAARVDDVQALSALAKRTWSDAFGGGVRPEDEASELTGKRSVAYFAGALAEHTILAAEDDGTLLGYAQFGDVRIPEVDVRAGDQALHRLYVETALLGRGLGRKLLEAALGHPRLAGATRVFLQVRDENERAVRLYESAGFRKVGTTTFAVGTETMEDAVLVLDKAGAARRAAR